MDLIGGVILMVLGVVGYVLLWFFGPHDAEEFAYYSMVPGLAFLGGFLSAATSL